MGNGLWMAIGQMIQLCFWTVRYLPKGGWKQLPRRTLAFGLAIPVFMLLQLVHWFGFLLDELFFFRYRRVAIDKPVFITGIPRSGTTHLQRVLSDHEQLTSMVLWECVFAPSITERMIYGFLGRKLSPLFNRFSANPTQLLAKMKSIHELGLTEPEEDFMVLTSINACFLMVVFFPEQAHFWRLVAFDQTMPTHTRKNVMRFYRRMIQKHLYVHGESLRYIAKNPSFMSWQKSLQLEFPTAKFVICHRTPEKTLPSQISSLLPAWQSIYGQPMDSRFISRLIEMMDHYYQVLADLTDSVETHRLVPMHQLVGELKQTVSTLCQFLELPETEVFRMKLAVSANAASSYRSTHHYSWQDLISNNADIGLRFERLYDTVQTR